MARAKKIQTSDGFQNLVANLGQGANNLVSQSTYRYQNRTREYSLIEAMYESSWIIGKIIDSVAEDMVRAGVTIKGSNTPADISRITKSLTRLGIWNALRDLIKWGRLYGGAIAVVQIEGQDLATPLQMDSIAIGQFVGLRIYDVRQAWPNLQDIVQYGPDAGLPRFYSLMADQAQNVQSEQIHHSRVIRAIGFKLPQYRALAYNLWGASIIERLYDRLVAFDSVSAGVANLISKAHLRTVKVKGLNEILSAGGKAEENLIKRFKYLAQLQNSEGVTILDGSDEYTADSYTFTGLSDVTLSFAQQLSGASGVPLVRIYEQPPAGLNSSGESTMRNYYDSIRAAQESTLEIGMLKLLEIIHLSVLGAPAPSDFDFEFTPLWQTSTKEKADIAAITTTTVISALDSGAIDAETAMQELRQQAEVTGIFTNITPEKIADNKALPPPIPEDAPPPAQTVDLKQQPQKIPALAGAAL